MKCLVALLLVLSSAIAFSQADLKLQDGKFAYYPQEFYTAKTAGKIERALLSRIFNKSHKAVKGQLDTVPTDCFDGGCYQHVSVGYDAARKIMFGELDKLTDAKGTYVLDVYCGKKFYFTNLNEVSNMHSRVNIEHTWPQSRFNGSYQRDMQKSDMHHLYLSDSLANSRRGNSPFGLVQSHNDQSDDSGCQNSRFGFSDFQDVYTPPVSHRGNVARSLFYFSMHYDLPIDATQEKILRQWHKSDPVDDAERARHEGVVRHQKIRNPFVDFPELADMVSDF